MAKGDVLAIGMAVADIIIKQVDKLPPKGGLEQVERFVVSTGGVASTFSRNAARLGLQVGLLATVGKDLLGDMLLSELRGDGIDTSLVLRQPDVPTGGTVVLVDSQGERSFYHYPGASLKLLAPSYVPLDAYRHIHLGGSPLVPEYDGLQGLKLFADAHATGVSTSIDTVYSKDGNWEATRELLRMTDIALPSYQEALELTGTQDPLDQARFLIDRGVEIAVIKLGEQGALILPRGGSPQFVHPPKIHPIDNTGAGEGFCAGFIFGYLNQWDLFRTSQFAVACGALATQTIGGPLKISSPNDIEEWMCRNGMTAP
ncbi:MAG: hypothetical protein C7B44_13230 [Sulfobacillus thermosulfidooxidans]|nr:MAG: hypothetical protein C7B44_13230 [Sulfobacillus thermosulfidooxidans]